MGFMDDVSGVGTGLMKFDGRSGTYVKIGSDESFNGQEFIVDVFNIKGGYVKFGEKGQAPEKHLGHIFPKDEAPLRSTLGNLDKSQWSKGKFSEEPEDPWRRLIEMPMCHKETGESYIFTAINNNALAAIKDLLGQCRRLPEGFLPSIRLNTASFKGKFGPVKKPVLTLNGKVPMEGEPDESDNVFDDEIPM
jgi:hypothetical protein